MPSKNSTLRAPSLPVKGLIQLMMGVYGTVWRLATPLLRRHKRLKEGFSWRLVPDDWAQEAASATQTDPQAHNVDIWIQSASGGEAYLAWALLERLPEALAQASIPDKPLRVLATTWTRQGLEVLQGMAGKLRQQHPQLSVRATFFPLDSPHIMARALDQAKPRMVVLLETELWPALLTACAARDIPVLVLNGRMTEQSLRHYQYLNPLTQHTFWSSCAPCRISAIAPSDAARFQALFDSPVDVIPNIKFDRAQVTQLAAITQPTPLAQSASPTQTSPSAQTSSSAQPDAPTQPDTPTQATSSTQPVSAPRTISTPSTSDSHSADSVVSTPLDPALLKLTQHLMPLQNTVLLASVREEEESALLTTIRQLRASHNVPTILIAPRHMHRVNAWKEALRKEGINAIRRSQHNSPLPAHSVILWDTFGELQQLYQVANAVFVGGSLAPLGGQNFLEALACGKIPCCGSSLDNFSWALEPLATTPSTSLEELALLVRCPDASTLASALQQQLAQPTSPESVQQRFQQWLTPRQGGSARCAALIAQELAASRP